MLSQSSSVCQLAIQEYVSVWLSKEAGPPPLHKQNSKISLLCTCVKYKLFIGVLTRGGGGGGGGESVVSHAMNMQHILPGAGESSL